MRAKTFGSSPSGRYSARGVSTTMIATLAATVVTIVTSRRRGERSNVSMPARTRSRSGCSEDRSSVPNDSRALAVGISVIATSIDAKIDAEIAIATSE